MLKLALVSFTTLKTESTARVRKRRRMRKEMKRKLIKEKDESNKFRLNGSI
jgi:hypothetical protein